MDKQLIYQVCESIRSYADQECLKCELRVETPYGPGVLGCVLHAQEIIRMVRVTDSASVTQ